MLYSYSHCSSVALFEKVLHENCMKDGQPFSNAYEQVQIGGQIWYLEMVNKLPDQDATDIYSVDVNSIRTIIKNSTANIMHHLNPQQKTDYLSQLLEIVQTIQIMTQSINWKEEPKKTRKQSLKQVQKSFSSLDHLRKCLEIESKTSNELSKLMKRDCANI